MIKQKIMCAAATVMLMSMLQGCGDSNYPDQAQLKVSELTLLRLQGVVSAQIHYFSQDDIESAKALITDGKALEHFISTPTALEEPKLNVLNNNTITQPAKALIIARQAADALWQQQVTQERDQLNHQLNEAKNTLSSLQAEEQKMQEEIKQPQQTVEAIEQQIESTQTRINELANATINAWNADIIEREIPIRKLSVRTRLYGYTSRSGPCKEDDRQVTIDRLQQENRCYYLALPDRRLKALPSTKTYIDNFDEYRTLREKIGHQEGSLHHQLNAAKQSLRDAKIIAENKFGSMRELSYRLRQSQNTVEKLERDLKQVGSSSQKQRFIRTTQSREAQILSGATNTFLRQRAAELLDNAEHSEALLDQPFELNSGADVLVLIMTSNGKDRNSWFALPKYQYKLMDTRKPIPTGDDSILAINMEDIRAARTKADLDIGILTAMAALPEKHED